MEADGVALTRVVTDHSIDAEVTQRLKRENTIYEKITQWGSGLDLSRMCDIGGCRVVLAHDDLEDLYVLVDWARKEWSEYKVITIFRSRAHLGTELFISSSNRMVS